MRRPYKSNAYVKFDETIYMDRFLPDADPEKRTQTRSLTQELINARAKLASLNSSKVSFALTLAIGFSRLLTILICGPKKSGPIAETMRSLAEALGSFPAKDDGILGLQATLKVESERIETDIASTEKRIEELLRLTEEVWAESQECAYELSAVFMHR